MDIERYLQNDYDENKTVVRVEHFTVWSPEERSWFRKKPIKQRSIILDNVSGSIKRGEFVAVLGPSGAGKTTFLVSLAGKLKLKSDGNIMVMGRNIKNVPKGVVEFAPQFDIFIDGLSVMEHLIFMIEMKIGSSEKLTSKLNRLLHDFSLTLHKETLIRFLSGGERRLLSLASVLVSNPDIIICDEPTTGLDSYSALMVTGALKRICDSGRVVICSMHQPSSEIFYEYNSIMLMAEGKLVFHGNHKECKEMFESVDLHCPDNSNPAEFYIGAISTKCKENFTIEKIHKMYDQYRLFKQKYSEAIEVNSSRTQKICRRHWLKQVQLLVWRSSVTFRRDIRKHIIQVLTCMVTPALILSLCFTYASGTTQRGVQDLRGFLWLVTSEVSFNLSYAALYAFDADLGLFKREVGMYAASAFFASRFLSFIPHCVIWPLVTVLVTSPAVGMPDRFLTTSKLILVLIVVAVASTNYGLAMGALFISSGLMADVMPCADLPLFLMSGAFLRISSLPMWLVPLKYFSHFYYGLDAMSNVYWRQIEKIECVVNDTSICVRDGVAVLEENGYSENYIFQDSVGLIFVAVFWNLLGYIGLKNEENKGYAY